MAKKRVALVLQGGGALGAFEYGAIKAIYEDGRFIPDVITGVSIGATNATLLVGCNSSDPVEALDSFWHQISTNRVPFLPQLLGKTLSLLGNPRTFKLRPKTILAPLFTTSIYDPTPIYKTMESLISIKKLNSSRTSVAITATNIQRGELVKFTNWGGNTILFDDIIASGSVPLLFPMKKVGDFDPEYYWDGGLVSNTPMGTAINRLEEIDPVNTEVRRYIISINLFPRTNLKIPSNMIEAANRVMEIMSANKTTADLKMFDTFKSVIGVIRDLEKTLPEDDPIREDPRFKKLARHRLITPIHITNTDPMPIADFLDFTQGNINILKNAGYIATKNTLANIDSDDE